MQIYADKKRINENRIIDNMRIIGGNKLTYQLCLMN